MSEYKIKNHDVFRERLINEMNVRGMKAVDLAKLCGVSKSSMSQYLSGSSAPKSITVYKMAEVFSVDPAWLMGFDVPREVNKEEIGTYYFDRKTAETASAIKNNEELSLLFDAARDASSEDLKLVHEMLVALKRKEVH